MKTSLACCLSFAFLAGCTGGSGEPPPDAAGSDATPVDGMPQGDARVGTMASVVPCAEVATAADVWYYAPLGYMPKNTDVLVGSVVRFHDLDTHTADHTNGLWSASGDASTCVQFDGLGTFTFQCYFHPEEKGTITVRY